MSTEELIDLFKELISLMELKGENPFKIRAYEKATDLLKASSINFETLISKIDGGNNLGFGPQIVKDFKEIKATGKLAIHQEFLKEIPREVLELLNIRGLGPKKIIQLQKELNIASLDSFKEALEKGALKTLKGFGEKTLISLQENLEFYLSSKGYFLIDVHENVLGKIIALAPENLIPEGVSRDKAEIFTELTLALRKTNLQDFLSILKNQSLDFDTVASENQAIHLTFSSVPVKISIKEDQDFLSAQNKLQENSKTFSLNESSLRGLLHMHSTYSDGLHSIRELAEEAKRLGYSYIGITDHSQSAGYAGGLRPDDIKAQHIEIERLNHELAPFRIFKGIESDILSDGALDYDQRILASFDFIVSSVHSGMTLSKVEMTKRIITAIRNPYTTILGHPTGRLLLKRKAYELDIKEILKIAKEEGVVVEINSNPRRLDLSWQEIINNKENLPKLTISPDAHSKEQLSLVRYGIMMANKADVKESSILNCADAKECNNFFKLRKRNA